MIMTSQHNSPCGICHKNILKGQKAIFCNKCSSFVHIKCNGISASEYRELANEPDVHWFCKLCIQDVFPFGSLGNEDLAALYDFDVPSFVDCSPSFKTTSNLVNLPNLSDYDID